METDIIDVICIIREFSLCVRMPESGLRIAGSSAGMMTGVFGVMHGISTREMLIETNRDVKWIRAALSEIKERENELDRRLRALEKSRKCTLFSLFSVENSLSLGIGAGAGGVTAILIRLFGG